MSDFPPPLAPSDSLPSRAAPSSLATHALAFTWGLAEATFFFLVPDILLTRVALTDFRRALLASLFAVAGALLGGTALWFATRHGATQFLLNAFDWIPGISRELIVRTAQALDTQGLPALASGALSGQPYKLYAVHAGAQDLALAPFLAVSAAARFARFALTVILAHLAARALSARPLASLQRLHAWTWFAFYTVYFALMR